jgi:pyruvate kinase
MRRTKIICTIGPKTCLKENILELARSGMDIARLNMSHGNHAWHQKVITDIKSINRQGKYSIAIMLDTKGPEIRTGDIKTEQIIKKGELFVFTIRREAEYQSGCTEVNYDQFINDVQIDDIILIDGGLLSFKVVNKTKTDVICKCLDGGIMASRRHLNIRGKSARLPSLTKKDWEDIQFGVDAGVDFIALSFVKNAQVIKDLRKFLIQNNVSVDIIAKIESADALTNLSDILNETDGAMVARGDLGAEIPVEEIPLLQEEIVHTCRQLGKPVIVATHLLESMIIHPTPTRAEVTDISEAVKEYSDALMLSGETAAGNYPFQALKVMDTVAKRMEQKLMENHLIKIEISQDAKKEIAHSASQMANHLQTKAIVAITRRGYMAKLLSQCRPNSPIYAFTNTTTVRRRLNIYWGVTPLLVKLSQDPEKTIQRAILILQEKKLVQKNDQIIIVSDILAGKELVETIQIRKV